MAKSPRETIKIRRLPKAGDRVTFSGDVLRVLEGEGRPLLIMPADSSTRIIIHSHWFAGGEKLQGNDRVELVGTVTRVVDGYLEDSTPIAVQVDGYAQARVTLPAKALRMRDGR